MSQTSRVQSTLGQYKAIQEVRLNVPAKDAYTSPHTSLYVTSLRMLE